MKTIIFNKVIKFGAFLINGLKKFFKFYGELNKDYNNLGTDYRISTIIGSGLFYSMF